MILGCQWALTTDVPWITIFGATSGNAGGFVNLAARVAANPDPVQRKGTITLTEAGAVLRILRVTVDASSCIYTASPPSAQFGKAGGSGTYIVRGVPDDCTFPPNPISGDGIFGSYANGIYYYGVQPNAGAARSATATLGPNQIFTVTQDAGDGSLQASCLQTGEMRAFLPFQIPLQCYLAGGTPPYQSWSLVGGAFPKGVTFPGFFSGRPTEAGPFSLTLANHDSSLPNPQVATVTVTGNVLPPLPSVSCSSGDGPAQLNAPYNVACARSGGVAPYHWSIGLGALPPGLSIRDGFDGGVIVSGTPTTAGPYYYALQLEDSSGPVPLTASQVFGGILRDMPLPLAVDCHFSPFDTGYEAGKALSFMCFASGGIPPYKISIGSADPSLGLAQTNQIGNVYAGTPASSGSFTVTMQASDNTFPKPQVATKPVSITVAPALTFKCTQPLGPNLVGQFYSTACSASGGIPPYIILPPGPLPPGLTSTLSTPTGADSFTISGVPTSATAYFYNATVTDSLNVTLQVTFSGTIGVGTPAPPPLSVTCAPANVSWEVGVPITPIQCAASGGTAPYSWSILPAGVLPQGLALSGTTGSTVSISGTPTASGNVSVNLNVVDTSPNRQSALWGLSGFIQVRPTISCTPNVGPVSVGQVYSMNCGVSGGLEPLNWSVTGSLPAGLSVRVAGVPGPLIYGAPISAGPYAYTVTLQDKYSVTVSQTFSGTISDLGTAGCSYSIDPVGQAFPVEGGPGSITISTGQGCPWSISGAPAFLTLLSGAAGSGNGTVNYTVTPNKTGTSLSATLTIAGISFTIEQEASIPGLGFVGSLAHIISAGTWETLVNYVNLGTTSAQVRTSIFGNDGRPLELPLDFPQLTAAGPLLGSSLDRTLAPGALLLMHSSGPDSRPTDQGWANIFSDGGVSGFAIFTNSYYKWNAAVPLEERNAPSYLLPFDNTGNIASGLAIANLSSQAANVPVIIRDDTGAQIDSRLIPLSANGHESFLLGDRYPAVKDKRGTVEFDTPAGGRISVLGLRFTGLQAATTVPVLANVTGGGGSMAHVAFSGGWDTTFTVVNTGMSSGTFTLNFYDDNGGPLLLPLRVLPSTVPASVASVTLTLQPGASVLLQTQGDDAVPFVWGSAVLNTTGAISAHATFRWNTFQQEATVPLETRTPGSFVMAFDNTNGSVAGLAVAEVSGIAVDIPVRVRDESGALMDTITLSLAAHGHTAFLAGERFPSTAGKRGTVEFVAPQAGKLSVLGLRMKGDGTLTTIPALAK